METNILLSVSMILSILGISCSCNHRTFVLFWLAYCITSLSMIFFPFNGWIIICCMHVAHFIHLAGHLCCFHLVAIVNMGETNTVLKTLFRKSKAKHCLFFSVFLLLTFFSSEVMDAWDWKRVWSCILNWGKENRKEKNDKP